MKKAALGSIVLAVVTLLACNSSLFAENKSLKIAMMQWRGETEGCHGFKDGLKELGYAVEYTTLNAGQDKKELGRLIREALLENLEQFDYVYSFGTTVSKATKFALKNRVPQLFNIVAAPVEADLVQSLDRPGENISGATNAVPLEVQLEAALQAFPFQRLGILFNSREKNSMIERKNLQAVAQQRHFEVVDLRAPPTRDMLPKSLQQLVEKSIVVDAVYLPPDSYMVSNAALIGEQLRVANLPSIASVKTFIEHGALIGVVVDYARLGKAVAGIVHRHQQGEQLRHIPVRTVKEPLLVINKTSSGRFNLTIPDAVLKQAIVIE